METCFVALDNSGVLTVKLGRETFLIAYSTDKRSNIIMETTAKTVLAAKCALKGCVQEARK